MNTQTILADPIWDTLQECNCFSLVFSRRYVCRFCTSHLDRVKKELLYRLHSNSEKEAPKQQTTTAQKRHQKEETTCYATHVAL